MFNYDDPSTLLAERIMGNKTANKDAAREVARLEEAVKVKRVSKSVSDFSKSLTEQGKAELRLALKEV